MLGVIVSWSLYAPVGRLRGVDEMMVGQEEMQAIWGGCAALLVLQSLVSRWWLARFWQGPLEKAWRWATWSGAQAR